MADNQEFVFGVDLDGTCADFYRGLRHVAAEWTGTPVEDLTLEVSWGLPEWDIDEYGGYDRLHRFAVTERELFKNLEPMEGAPQVLRKLATEDIRIRIITHRLFIPYFHQVAVQQTVAWLDAHDIPYWDLCFMRDKAQVGADLYVEDSPKNVEALRSQGQDTIVFDNSTNRHLDEPRAKTWNDVYDLVMERLEEWRATQI